MNEYVHFPDEEKVYTDINSLLTFLDSCSQRLKNGESPETIADSLRERAQLETAKYWKVKFLGKG
jgi:hypothetical protein